MFAALLILLALALDTGPAIAIDMLDYRQFQDSGYRRCQQCDLSGVQLQGVNLKGADLRGANLVGAQLQNADLRGAQLRRADLTSAELQNADLRAAGLENAILRSTSIEGAKLASAHLSGAVYNPTSAPNSNVAGITGLSTVRAPYNHRLQLADVAGLVLLRELLQRAGLRDLEREATYSIERARTCAFFQEWFQDPRRLEALLSGAFRFAAFGFATCYGLKPLRALLIMIGLTLAFSFAYLPWISHQGQSRRGAIYRTWPSERLVDDGQGVRLQIYGEVPPEHRIERLEDKTYFRRWFYCALWFSTLSAFHIGWRELSVGTWLSRLQLREYTLRAQGWPRRISGLQSLISVYLVAIWALTQFGRPFQ